MVAIIRGTFMRPTAQLVQLRAPPCCSWSGTTRPAGQQAAQTDVTWMQFTQRQAYPAATRCEHVACVAHLLFQLGAGFQQCRSLAQLGPAQHVPTALPGIHSDGHIKGNLPYSSSLHGARSKWPLAPYLQSDEVTGRPTCIRSLLACLPGMPEPTH